MIEFRMPSLGADMDEGTLLEWKVRPGDVVSRGQIVAVVDTSKAAIDVEIWQEGTIAELLVQPGSTVPVGTVMATLRESGAGAEAAPPAPAPAPPAARRAISPAARHRAGELGVALDSLVGTGPSGAVTLADVEREASGRAAAPAARQDWMRRATAAAMSRSKREIPHYYLSETVPLGRASEWLARENERRPITGRLLMLVLELKALALALREVPELNGFYRDGMFQPGAGIHVGVAVSTRQGGLVAPAIHDVDRKGLDQIMRELSDLVARVRAGSLRSSELSEPTITVTNLGDQGVESVLGVIHPPQVALVGLGRVCERPWVEQGAVRAMRVVTVTLSADHRVSDGHRGARFLSALGGLLQRPEALDSEAPAP